MTDDEPVIIAEDEGGKKRIVYIDHLSEPIDVKSQLSM